MRPVMPELPKGMVVLSFADIAFNSSHPVTRFRIIIQLVDGGRESGHDFHLGAEFSVTTVEIDDPGRCASPSASPDRLAV